MMSIQQPSILGVQPLQYLPNTPSGNTVQVMNSVANANLASNEYAGMSNVFGQAMQADLTAKMAEVSSKSKGIRIRLSDIKSEAQTLSKMTPEMAVAAGFIITDDNGNVLIGPGASQQPQSFSASPQQQWMPQQQQQQAFAFQQPQQAQQLSSQQQYALYFMQQLEQMQAQLNQSSQGAFTANNGSTEETPDYWGNEINMDYPAPSTNNAQLQAQINQMAQMVQSLFMQGAMPAQMGSQQSSQFALQQIQQPSQKMTLLDYKAMAASANMVVNQPTQSAFAQIAQPQPARNQSALTQRVMEQMKQSFSV
jgi:hypothetical protein